MRNGMTIYLKFTRVDVCDLLLACFAAEKMSHGATKWAMLHDKIERQLEDFDDEIDTLLEIYDRTGDTK